MLARIPQSLDATDSDSDWLVLIDQDTYDLKEDSLAKETIGDALPARLRFTVAHELAHSLAFRPMEFGFALERKSDATAQKDFIHAIEREADNLAPLLLLPPQALNALGALGNARAAELESFRKTFGVSRPVLVNRLRQLLEIDRRSWENIPTLHNFALLIGEWKNGEAVLRKWPRYFYFSENSPTFLRSLTLRDRIPVPEILDDSDFILCGGETYSGATDIPCGPIERPTSNYMRVEYSAAPAAKSKGGFLLAVRLAHRT